MSHPQVLRPAESPLSPVPGSISPSLPLEAQLVSAVLQHKGRHSPMAAGRAHLPVLRKLPPQHPSLMRQRSSTCKYHLSHPIRQPSPQLLCPLEQCVCSSPFPRGVLSSTPGFGDFRELLQPLHQWCIRMPLPSSQPCLQAVQHCWNPLPLPSFTTALGGHEMCK